MKLNIRTRNYQITDKVKQYLEKRLKKLDKLLDKDTEATVTLISERKMQRIEITMPVNGFILRGEEDNEDMLTAIDRVTDKLEKQLVRSKERFSKKGRLSVTKLPTFAGVMPAVDDEEELKVRTKHYPMEPMNLDEAITRMDMIGHTFFVFNNDESGEINVVYRRNDGHYGLLEPEA
jgi:putative sigma-54 modulation protein